jgi:hypothetical protein
MKFSMIAAASLAALTPVAASAQDTANAVDPYATTQPQEEDEFPWGLLGLLGLAGLLGLKRRDDRRVDVDNRRP